MKSPELKEAMVPSTSVRYDYWCHYGNYDFTKSPQKLIRWPSDLNQYKYFMSYITVWLLVEVAIKSYVTLINLPQNV